jgi:hypothetical protein
VSDWVHTHDAMADLIRAAAPGARVTFRPVARGSDKSRAYSITVERLGREPVNVADAYALPCAVEPVRAHVRDLLSRALAGA